MTDLRELADLHVLGLLEGEAAEALEARIAAPRTPEDRALAAAVGAARDRFLPLDLTAPEMAPAADGWARLADRIARDAASSAPAAPAQAALSPQAGPTQNGPDALRPRPTSRPTVRPAALGRWRAAAFAGLAASVALAVMLGWRTLLAPQAAVVAILVNEAGQPAALVEAFADDSVVVTPLLDFDAGPTRALQVWTKPDPDGPPVSLGLLDAVTRLRVRGPDLPAPHEGQLYEITVEQPGGSPTGLPTGPIVGKGLAQRPL